MTIQLNGEQLEVLQTAFLEEYTKAKADVLYVNKAMLKDCIKGAVNTFNKLGGAAPVEKVVAKTAPVEKVVAKTAKPKKEKKERK